MGVRTVNQYCLGHISLKQRILLFLIIATCYCTQVYRVKFSRCYDTVTHSNKTMGLDIV